MSGIRVLIIEDELLVAQELKMQLAAQGYEVLDTVDNATDAKRALRIYQLDLVLVDIKLRGEEDGIDIAGHINEAYGLPLIFISSLIDNETIKRARACRPAAYLVKPYNVAELFIAIDMALYNHESGHIAHPNDEQNGSEASHYLLNQHVFIKDKHRFERVELKSILWLKAEGSYVNIATDKKEYLITTETLKSFLAKLKTDMLERVHRSFAVNLQHVEALEGFRLIIKGEEIPIGKNFLQSIQQKLRFL